MIVLSDHSKAMLDTPGAYSIILVSILGTTGNLIYASTSHFVNMTLPKASIFPNITVTDGAGIPLTQIEFLADGSLVGIQAPKLSTSVDRELYTVTLTDSVVLAIAANDWGLVGNHLKVSAIFTANGDINTSPENILTIYSGRINGVTNTRRTDEIGESMIKLTAGSPMYGLDQKNGIYFSDPKIKERNKEDTCAENVYVSARSAELHWGK
jgi:hypothetical protein